MGLVLPWLVVSVALSQAPGYYTPEEAEAIFREGLEAHARSDFDRAEKSYLKLIDRGYGGADVLYNLGTTHLVQEEIGPAVLYLERAWRTGARDEDLEANLLLARSKQRDDVIGAQSHRTLNERISDTIAPDTAAALFAFCWGGVFLLLVLRRLVTSLRRPLTGALAVLLGAGTLGSGGILATHVWRSERMNEAVVLAPTLAVRDVPDSAAPSKFEVHEGLKIRLLEATAGFARIRLPNGVEGWADAQGLTSL